MRKYNGKSNYCGSIIKSYREKQNLSREQLAEKLQLEGLNIDRNHVLRMEKEQVILKDFELLIIAKILKIDLNEIKI